MTNDPWRKRTPRSTLIQWLLEHTDVWKDYPSQSWNRAVTGHAEKIFAEMQNDGLFSHRSQCNPKTITRLVGDARAAMQIKRININFEV